MTPVGEITIRERVIVDVFIDIDSRACRCGQMKRQGSAFCRGCYYSLPEEMQRPLHGSRERIPKAYLLALKHLAHPSFDCTEIDADLAALEGRCPSPMNT